MYNYIYDHLITVVCSVQQIITQKVIIYWVFLINGSISKMIWMVTKEIQRQVCQYIKKGFIVQQPQNYIDTQSYCFLYNNSDGSRIFHKWGHTNCLRGAHSILALMISYMINQRKRWAGHPWQPLTTSEQLCY